MVWFLQAESGSGVLVHPDGDVEAVRLLLDPVLPVVDDVFAEVVPPVAHAALPDEAAVAGLVGVVGGHVDALVVAEGVNVEVSLKLRNLKGKANKLKPCSFLMISSSNPFPALLSFDNFSH